MLWAHDPLVRFVERAKIVLSFGLGASHVNREHFHYPIVKGENIMKNVNENCKITTLNVKDEEPSDFISAMLAKAGAEEFVIGHKGKKRVSWSVAVVDDELYALRLAEDDNGSVWPVGYNVDVSERGRVLELYDQVAEDVVSDCDFRGFVDPTSAGLQQLLSVFGRKFSNFMSRVLYFYSMRSPKVMALAEEG